MHPIPPLDADSLRPSSVCFFFCPCRFPVDKKTKLTHFSASIHPHPTIMALRTSLNRLALSPSTVALSPALGRSLTTRPISIGQKGASVFTQTPRFFSTTPRIRLEASLRVGDGGNTEPPEHGINVDKSMRMDRSVAFPILSCGRELITSVLLPPHLSFSNHQRHHSDILGFINLKRPSLTG